MSQKIVVDTSGDSRARKRQGLTSLFGWVALSLVALPGEAQLSLESCRRPGISEQVQCGTLSVAENPDEVAGRSVNLKLVVVPALSPDPEPDPLFILAGGPGQAATDMIPMTTRMLAKVRKTRDLVYVDQRGTGESNGLACDIGDPLVLFLTGSLTGNPIEQCIDQLSEVADLTRYTTFHAMPDLDKVRQALGYERINLWGGSYGTRAALVYQHLYPEHTRALVLDGLAPFELRLPLHNAREAQRAWDMLLADCAADEACRKHYPDPGGRLDALLERLANGPILAVAPHPLSGEMLDLSLTREAVAGTVRAALYGSETAALLPMALEEATAGRFGPLLALGLKIARGTTQTMSLGMTMSVLCSEDFGRIDPAEVESSTADTFLGTTEFDSWRQACELWPKAELAEGFHELRGGSTPALLLSGDADPVVPPRWAEPVEALLSEAEHVVVPGTGHIVSGTGCVPSLIAEFLERGDATDLDTSCVERIRRPPFMIDYYGPRP